MESRDETVSETVKASGGKVPLQTYSRHVRNNKRRSITLPEHLPRPKDLTTPDNHGDTPPGAQGGRQERMKRRTTAPMSKTITEVFWEHLSSSAPVCTPPPEIGHLGLSIPIEAEEVSAPIEKQSQGHRAGEELHAKCEDLRLELSLGQRNYNPSQGLRVFQDIRQDGRNVGQSDKGENLSHPGDFNDKISRDTLTPRPKQRRLLCISSPPTPQTKRVRRSLDVDESLSALEAASADVIPLFKSSTTRCKDSDFPGFRKFRIANETRVTHSVDGFEHEEARPSVVGKRRRLDTIDRSIGPLELTQQIVASQKIEGPTWIRGQKKSRIATATSPWRKKQYSSTSQFHIDSEDDNEWIQVKQSKPTDQSTRNRPQRCTSNFVSDDNEDTVARPDPDALTHGINTRSKADVEAVRKVRARRVIEFPHISDADEPVMLLADPAGHEEDAAYVSDGDASVGLLVYPEDNEDEAGLATIPRTDIPENIADTDQADGQLPPKQWVLNVLDCEDTLALRPDSREWMREVEIPEKSPLK